MSAADDAVSAPPPWCNAAPPTAPAASGPSADAAAATAAEASRVSKTFCSRKPPILATGPPGSAACTIRVNAPLPWCRTCSAVNAAHLVSPRSAALDPFFPLDPFLEPDLPRSASSAASCAFSISTSPSSSATRCARSPSLSPAPIMSLSLSVNARGALVTP